MGNMEVPILCLLVAECFEPWATGAVMGPTGRCVNPSELASVWSSWWGLCSRYDDLVLGACSQTWAHRITTLNLTHRQATGGEGGSV